MQDFVWMAFILSYISFLFLCGVMGVYALIKRRKKRKPKLYLIKGGKDGNSKR